MRPGARGAVIPRGRDTKTSAVGTKKDRGGDRSPAPVCKGAGTHEPVGEVRCIMKSVPEDLADPTKAPQG